METLSSRRRQILDFITAFIQERDYPPSVRDIGEGCGISSSSVVQYHLNILEQQGYIHRGRDISRSVGLTKKRTAPATIPMLGTIAAGEPIPVPSADTWITNPEETIDVPGYLTHRLDRLYALKVKGMSMVDALIDDGDIVIMQAASTAEDGETVAVWLKDKQEVTLKRIYHESGRVCLKPGKQVNETNLLPARKCGDSG